MQETTTGVQTEALSDTRQYYPYYAYPPYPYYYPYYAYPPYPYYYPYYAYPPYPYYPY